MQSLSDNILKELERKERLIVPVVEIYPRTVDEFVPSNALGLFASSCFTWRNSTGVYEYDGKITSFPDVSLYLNERINSAEVEFNNVERGENSGSRFVLNNKIKGCWMVIKLLYPNEPEESQIVFWGKCGRPGAIDNETLSLTAKQDLGNSKVEIPFRDYGIKCPLDFARPLGACLGDETLAEKSLAYRQAVNLYGSAGCNKLFTTCSLLGNTRYFQGQRVVAVSGQFSYVTVEEVIKRVLFWTKRKKITKVKTDNWSSVNQSEGNETVPMAFGRCQIQGHPITWADVGTEVKSLQGFCEGPISAFTFIRSRTEGINIVGVPIEHLGEYGGRGSQQLDSIFNGVSGYNSRLAYLEIVTNGSSPTQVDDAPIVTAVIRGLMVPTPDENGEFTREEWTNNPSFIARFLLTDLRLGRIPTARIDDEVCIDTANDCDEIIEDRTNEEFIVLPSNELPNYGVSYRRFTSASRYSAFKDMFVRGILPPQDRLDPYAEFGQDPFVTWFNPFEPYIQLPLRSVLKQKYTFNGALQEKTSLLDFINERVLPTFKGYIHYGANGKIQIKNRRKADNAYLRADLEEGASHVPVTNIKPWRSNLDGYLLIGVSKETAEIRTVTGFTYSTACNGVPVFTEDFGGVTTSSFDLAGGNASSPAKGYIYFEGTPAVGDEVRVTIDTGENAFSISYIADGIEDLETFVRMFMFFLNANVQFAQSFTAYRLPDNPYKIIIQCEVGYLNVNKPLEYDHDIAEEVMRVQAVFENCGELTANTSAQFDNIYENTFKWNEDEADEVNAIVAKYTSAVDDFHLTNIMPRAGWDTIDLEGELVKDDLDLTFVDNYWQAAYLVKGEAIDRIDGNLHFSLETNILAIRLELGDVVAVRHDSGDGALNYTPCWITKSNINLNELTVKLGMKLYLSAAFDYHVQPVEPLLTTTLNPEAFPQQPPTSTGTTGGIGNGSEPVVIRPVTNYYDQFARISGKYSPTGKDIV